MEFRILGPLEVLDRGETIEVAGSRQRALLADLLIHANQLVSTDRLLDDLWGERPPATGVKALQVTVSELRKALGDGFVVTRPQGYLLRVDAEAVDARRFARLVGQGRRALEAGDPAHASEVLASALRLWRGPALTDVAFDDFARPEIERLEELRLAAIEDRVDADLELGRHAVLAGELRALVAEYPLRERLRGQLMRALYGAGRQAEALAEYQSFRRLLRDELGIEPSPLLRHLEGQILRQDTELDPRRRSRQPVSLPRRRRRLIGAGVAVAALAATAAVALRAEGDAVTVPANSIAVLDPATNQVVAAIPVGESPDAIAAADDSLFVVNHDDDTMSQIWLATKSVIRTFAGDIQRFGLPGVLAAHEGALWLAGSHEIRRFDLRAGLSISTIRPRKRPDFVWNGVASGLGSIWVVDTAPRLVELEPSIGTIEAVVPFGPRSENILPRSAVAVGEGGVWVSHRPLEGASTVWRYDPETRRVSRTTVDGSLGAIAAGSGGVWVVDSAGEAVIRFDPRTLQVTHRVPAGDGPSAVAVGAGAVWVTSADDGTVSRIDPSAGQVVKTVTLGHRPVAVAVANGLVWIAVRSS